MRIRTRVDDVEVTLAFYGSIVYLAVVSALGAQEPPPRPAAAVSTVVASGTVLYLAHVFASLVPRAARAGRIHVADLRAALRHDVPLVVSLVVPIVPLALATWDVLSVDTGYRLSVRLTMAMLFVLAVSLSRRDGLSWGRAIGAAAVIIAITVAVIWLEARVH